MPMVEEAARDLLRRAGPHIELDDMIQDGMVGLIGAADRYTNNRRTSFRSFAGHRIRGAIVDGLRRNSWPRGIRRRRREMQAAAEAFREEHGRDPDAAELAERTGHTAETVRRNLRTIRLLEYAARGEDEARVAEDDLPAVMRPSRRGGPEEQAEADERRRRIAEAVKELTARERRLVRLYYWHEESLKQAGAELGVSMSRAHQILQATLGVLKTRLERNGHRAGAKER